MGKFVGVIYSMLTMQTGYNTCFMIMHYVELRIVMRD